MADAGTGVAAPVGPEPILALLANANIEKGQKLSKACAACHSFDNGGADKVGPNLWNVVNRPIGSKAGFAYSDVLASAGEDWTFENLNAFMWKPKKSYPGTKMNYIGLKKPQQRADIIMWLRTLSDNPVALPPVPAAPAATEESPAEES